MKDKQFDSVAEALEDSESRRKKESEVKQLADPEYDRAIKMLATYWERVTRQEHDGKYNQSSYFFENFIEEIRDDIEKLLPPDEGLPDNYYDS